MMEGKWVAVVGIWEEKEEHWRVEVEVWLGAEEEAKCAVEELGWYKVAEIVAKENERGATTSEWSKNGIAMVRGRNCMIHGSIISKPALCHN